MKSTNGAMSRNITILCAGIALLAVGCSPSAPTPSNPTIINDGQALAASGAISVEDASAEQCPAGGKVYSVYLDANHNGLKEITENAVSIQVVCNGLNGANGKSSLITSTRVETYGCQAGTGLQIQVGLDNN